MRHLRPVAPFLQAWTLALGALFLLLLPGAGHAATNPTEAKVFIEQLSEQAIAALTPPEISREERERRCRDLLRANFAVETIGQFVLGRHWRTATPEERAEFMTLFEDFIVDTYADRFSRYTGQKLDVYDATTEPETGDALVKSQIQRASGAPVQVGWRVRQMPEGLRIVDVSVEGVSMGVTQRSDFASVIRNNGGTVAGLIDEMRKRVRSAG
jgi:ABC-type transport system involved in resistance to organic solvents, auxiliary component